MKEAPSIDLSNCTECESCLELCPEVFRRNSMGYIEVVELDEYPGDKVREAIAACPSDCIRLAEAENSEKEY